MRVIKVKLRGVAASEWSRWAAGDIDGKTERSNGREPMSQWGNEQVSIATSGSSCGEGPPSGRRDEGVAAPSEHVGGHPPSQMFRRDEETAATEQIFGEGAEQNTRGRVCSPEHLMPSEVSVSAMRVEFEAAR